MPAGVYLLLLWLGRRRRIRVGSLGTVSFPVGLYLYAGSARRGLGARIGRHRRRIKSPHWHIDYLRRHARLLGAAVAPWAPGRECGVARAALGLLAARAVAPGFGSSDCGCLAHLAHVGDGAGLARQTVRCGIWATVRNKPHGPWGESERAITSRRTAGVRRWGPPLSVGPAGRAARLRSLSASAGAFPANEAGRAHSTITSAPLSRRGGDAMKAGVKKTGQNDLKTLVAAAKELGVSPAALRKAVEAASIHPDVVRCGCAYYGLKARTSMRKCVKA